MSQLLEPVTQESVFEAAESYEPKVITSELFIEEAFSYHQPTASFGIFNKSLSYEALSDYWWFDGEGAQVPSIGRSLEDYRDVYKITPEEFGQLEAYVKFRGRVKRTFKEWQEIRLNMRKTQEDTTREATGIRDKENPVFYDGDPDPTLIAKTLFDEEVIKDPRKEGLIGVIEWPESRIIDLLKVRRNAIRR